MRLYNTLSRTVEAFTPINQPEVGLYACGFTVYDFTHLGHLRKYSMDDVLIRTLRYLGYKVKFVQNITDVGHLASDGDSGEDKLEKGAKKYGKTVWDIAHEFEDYFWRSMDLMGNVRPDISCRATEHIKEQLAMVMELEKKGFTYVIEGDGVYFDSSKFPTYTFLSKIKVDKLEAGSRIEMVKGKRNLTDFAVWKFERPGENRAMVWESPWHPRSFPGWHIECSAMAIKYLGEQFDIHTGGIDHIPVHHTNEIAQAESASGKSPFVKFWVHHNFLRVDGEKMSKSLGNFFTIDDVLKRGITPMAIRLLFLTTHYRSEMNFTWDALNGAAQAYKRLTRAVVEFKQETRRNELSPEKLRKLDIFRKEFFHFLEDDLKTPEAVSTMWELVKSGVPSRDKFDLLMEFDEVLGLGLKSAAQLSSESHSVLDSDQTGVSSRQELKISSEVAQLLNERQAARLVKDWKKSDQLRQQLLDLGHLVQDGAIT